MDLLCVPEPTVTSPNCVNEIFHYVVFNRTCYRFICDSLCHQLIQLHHHNNIFLVGSTNCSIGLFRGRTVTVVETTVIIEFVVRNLSIILYCKFADFDKNFLDHQVILGTIIHYWSVRCQRKVDRFTIRYSCV